jgi:phage baseplate assembly protein V
MDTTADLSRRLENLIRLGTIAAVDPVAKRCRVQTGDLETDWLRWFALRAGEDRTWDPPSEGEQCMLFSPSGEPALGVVLVGLYSDQFDAPDDNPNRRRRTYRDGAVVEYDTETHTLRATLPAAGNVELVAPGGVFIVGDVSIVGSLSATEGATITGTITASVDVDAAGISLVDHVHGGVQPGSGTTGAPQ